MKLTTATLHQPKAPPSACVRPTLSYNARCSAPVALSFVHCCYTDPDDDAYTSTCYRHRNVSQERVEGGLMPGLLVLVVEGSTP